MSLLNLILLSENSCDDFPSGISLVSMGVPIRSTLFSSGGELFCQVIAGPCLVRRRAVLHWLKKDTLRQTGSVLNLVKKDVQ